MINKALPGVANDIKNWSRKQDLILFHSHSEKTIGTYYLLDISKKKKPKMEKLLDLAEWIDPDKLSPMKSIQYTARDGLVINGYLTIPKGSDGKNIPLIVHPHGGPSARDYWGWNPDVQFLANQRLHRLRHEAIHGRFSRVGRQNAGRHHRWSEVPHQ